MFCFAGDQQADPSIRVARCNNPACDRPVIETIETAISTNGHSPSKCALALHATNQQQEQQQDAAATATASVDSRHSGGGGGDGDGSVVEVAAYSLSSDGPSG